MVGMLVNGTNTDDGPFYYLNPINLMAEILGAN